MKNDNSCLNCQKRHIGCHKDCENYLQYKKDLDKIKQNKKLEKLITFKNRRSR